MNVYETIEEVFGLDEDEVCEPTTNELDEDINPCDCCQGCDI